MTRTRTRSLALHGDRFDSLVPCRQRESTVLHLVEVAAGRRAASSTARQRPESTFKPAERANTAPRMAHATPGASPHPRRPSLSPLAVKDWPGAARSTTLTDATDLHGRKAAHALPLPRRAFSDEVVVLASTAAQGPLRRKDSFVEDWRLSVSPPVYDLDSCVEHLGLSPRSLNEPSSSDSGLFSEKRSVAGAQILRPPAAGDVHRTASFGQGEGAHFLASEWSLSFDGRRDSPFDVDDFTDSFSPGGLEVDFGGRRGRRASRGMDDGESMSRSGVARTAASRRVLSVGKTGPS